MLGRLGLTVALVALLPALAAAEASDAERRAREYFAEGVRRMRASDWAGAEDRFRSSVDLFPTQAGLFNLGSAVLAQDRPEEALEVFDDYIRRYRSRASEGQLAEVERMRSRALARLCEVTIDVSPEGAEVLVDDVAVGHAPLEGPLVLEEGDHSFAARLDGYEEREIDRRLEGGCRGEAIAISLRAVRMDRGDGRPVPIAPPGGGAIARPGPHPNAVAGWVVLALAGASGLAASITGGVVLSLRQEFGQMSMTDDWGPVQDEGRALALTTDILIGLASAAAAICIPLLITGYRSVEAPR